MNEEVGINADVVVTGKWCPDEKIGINGGRPVSGDSNDST